MLAAIIARMLTEGDPDRLMVGATEFVAGDMAVLTSAIVAALAIVSELPFADAEGQRIA